MVLGLCGKGNTKMQLKDFIKTYDNFLDSDSCDMLMSAFEKSRPHHVEKHDTELYKFEQLNLNRSGMSKMALNILQGISPFFDTYFTELGVSDYIGVQSFEEVRIKKYYKNSDYQFKTHIDVSDAPTSKRYVVAIVYLNDNDGVTSFPQLDCSITPKKGSVVIFPPNWQYLHAGGIPTDHDKYILMTYLNFT